MLTRDRSVKLQLVVREVEFDSRPKPTTAMSDERH